MDNDIDALVAMMYLVQDREPSSLNDVVGEWLCLLAMHF